jgi:hypothetical protein
VQGAVALYIAKFFGRKPKPLKLPISKHETPALADDPSYKQFISFNPKTKDAMQLQSWLSQSASPD